MLAFLVPPSLDIIVVSAQNERASSVRMKKVPMHAHRCLLQS